MTVIGSISGLGGTIACCAVIFVLLLVVLVLWYWRHEPKAPASAQAPESPNAGSVADSTVAKPVAESPTMPAEQPSAEEHPAPPSADD